MSKIAGNPGSKSGAEVTGREQTVIKNQEDLGAGLRKIPRTVGDAEAELHRLGQKGSRAVTTKCRTKG